MTGYTVHTGSSVKFSEGWDQIFKGKKSGSQPAAEPSPRPAPATSKKSVKRKTAKKKR